MKYPLDCEDNFSKSFLFWIAKFLKFKLNSLSNKLLEKAEELREINIALSKNNFTIEELDELAKKSRNIGMIGVNTYFNPIKKFYEQIIHYKLYSLKLIDEELVIEILSSITAGLSDASKKNHKIAIVNFFKFLSSQNKDDDSSYVYEIELKNWSGLNSSSGQKLPEFMSEEQMKTFLNTLNNYEFKSNQDRNKLAIKIILFTGVRVNEVLRLRLKDISYENDLISLRIHAKGNKYRVVLLNINSIKEHLEYFNNFAEPNQYLFTNKQGKPLTQAYISRLIENVLLAAGIRKEKNGAHMLRHSFATLLYKKEKDLLLVQEALGHASLNTSRIYTHFDNDKLKLAAKIANNLKED
ncbi:tyrosine-type recombinase/integrase [Campylobacter sp. RM12642]|uniref:tyrosine-type recombinase/integrase n=1 Tax=unclassified Campylobacter TaxID=2593542 RepID=UPI001BDA76FD|nr:MULTISPECIES: tyrosine-type recombinase/integrase [unclassified Campylobacter]MBZ7975986.1 tyrosine-type recombinase/integrase [Campylobacter sp. RM12637]MBZ7980862.1 tyrosine-type recombinase/integrase [Campylobacter sp. RM12642]MBZ7983434.1 tyrosine-type recombinase/integrase [Campylobacter sp. RM12647]MBZ7993824.1 tyrosine-type recombinase/integrase [Campylobacter sp. RM9333]MBT0879568.1 tyrosine-type recombinase/integrase [Campylobacter sp. 2018MI01]